MRILVAEDDPIALGFLELSLGKWGYSVEAVTDGKAALQALTRSDAPKLAILDWMMPDIDGIDVCRELRKPADNDQGYTYIILLTVKSSLHDMVEGIAAGADDYIIKPFIPQDLKVRLDAGKRIVDLQEKLVESKRILVSTSYSDLATRTWNREKIISLINAELNRSKRKGRSQSLALLRIDNYTELMEKAGDKKLNEFLCNALKRVQTTVRSYDSVGRYTDDQFLILFPETTSEEMPGIMTRLFRTIHDIELSYSGGRFPFSVSIGVVSCSGNIAEDTLIAEANKAMTKAPREGDTRIHFSVVE